MLFQVTTHHTYKNCPARAGGFQSELFQTAHEWVNGNAKVKILGAWASPTSHTGFSIIEADDMESLVSLLKEPMLNGNVEITPVIDLTEVVSKQTT